MRYLLLLLIITSLAFTTSPKSPLSKLFTSHSEKAFDLYLYLAKKAQNQNSTTIKINYQEFAQALGYTKNYYFNALSAPE